MIYVNSFTLQSAQAIYRIHSLYSRGMHSFLKKCSEFQITALMI